MNTSKICAVIGATLIVGVGLYKASIPLAGWILEKQAEECLHSDTDTTCNDKMRGLGHYWSGKGDLNKAQPWYQAAAEHNDVVAMFHLAWVHRQLGKQIHAANPDTAKTSSE